MKLVWRLSACTCCRRSTRHLAPVPLSPCVLTLYCSPPLHFSRGQEELLHVIHRHLAPALLDAELFDLVSALCSYAAVGVVHAGWAQELLQQASEVRKEWAGEGWVGGVAAAAASQRCLGTRNGRQAAGDGPALAANLLVPPLPFPKWTHG